MRNVFSPDEIDLTDTYGDPGRVIAVQQKIRTLFQELTEADRFQQEAIKEQILQEGTWALPGLVNSTYVFIHELENNNQAQKVIVDMMVKLAADSQDGKNLIFRIGFLRNPFSVPRKIARQSLEGLKWQPSVKEYQDIEKFLLDYRNSDDLPAVVDFYQLLLSTQNKRGYDLAINDLKKWTAQSNRAAGDLLALLLHFYPDKSDDILTQIILMIPDDRLRDNTFANALLNSLIPIPTYLIDQNILLSISHQILNDRKPRKFLELLWMQAIKDYRDAKIKSVFQQAIQDLGQNIQGKSNYILTRYWFRAMGKILETGYIYEQTKSSNDSWRLNAVTQLFFMKRNNPNASQCLKDLARSDPDLFERGKNRFEELNESPADHIIIEEPSEPAGLIRGKRSKSINS